VKALWIRVDAHAIDSIEVARFAEQLDVDVVTAFGHYCALGGAIAEHAPDGNIADVPDAGLGALGALARASVASSPTLSAPCCKPRTAHSAIGSTRWAS
jgi:hypothetical protein